MLDLNDAQPQRGDLIPAGCAKVQAALRPSGATMPGAPVSDVGLLRASRSSDVLMLDFEFTVLDGPHRPMRTEYRYGRMRAFHSGARGMARARHGQGQSSQCTKAS